MKKTRIQLHIRFAAFFLLALLAVGLCPSACSPVPSYAASTGYSSVLEDLQKDESFNASEYPDNKVDYDKSEFAKTANFYSIHVIQIAESTNGELFVYTYQPCAGIKQIIATSISLSTTIDEDYAPQPYTLTKLSVSGVFEKYLVNGFEVETARKRYYEISEIFRAWDSELDEPDENGNVISEVPYEVGKLYTATTNNGVVSYECRAVETISVISKYCGYLRPKNGSIYDVYSYDEHFLAFDTDLAIDTLLEADVSFRICMRRRNWIDGIKVNDYYMTAFTDATVTVTCEELTNSNVKLPWEKPKTWKTIERVSDFIAKENLTDEAKERLEGKQWVLRFLYTPYVYQVNGNVPLMTASLTTEEVADETILRLKFETDGIVYNLGCVDNKQAPDPEAPPDDTPSPPVL